MTKIEIANKTISRACLGNEEAMHWLNMWGTYVHAIDDIEDTKTDAEFRLKTFALAVELYTHPFFLKNIDRLKQIVLSCTNAFADSVEWEKSDEEWKRNFADHYRHFGVEMVLAVAGICAGPRAYEHMRSISLEYRTICWCEHHTQDGKAV